MPLIQRRWLIEILLILVVFILIFYQSQPHSCSSLSLSNALNCVKSLLESNDFICESDYLWNERKILHRIQDRLNMQKITSYLFFLSAWEPDFHCSHARRIGRMGDGGKWVCDVFRLQNRSDCLVYSAGSSGDFTFEIDMKKNAPNCEIHTFDFGQYRCPPNVCTFHQMRLGDGKSHNNARTWSMIIKELGHENRLIDVFKVDIESWEFEFFPTIFQAPAVSHPRQILVEIHPPNATVAHRFFEALRANNYVIFNKEPNLLNNGGLYEYAFLKLNSEFFK